MKALRFIPSIEEGMKDAMDRSSLRQRLERFLSSLKKEDFDYGAWREKASKFFNVKEDELYPYREVDYQLVVVNGYNRPKDLENYNRLTVVRSVLNAIRCSYKRKVAKEKAAKVGLIYWPALLEENSCDPKAFVAAEKVMIPLFGEWNPKEGNHGGFDSKGYHGMSPSAIRRMWFAAGCKDNPKFRLQVATGIIAKKGDKLNWLMDYARGFKWMQHKNAPTNMSRNAIAALGRLSPYLRWAAIQIEDVDYNRKIRIRDLNWGLVSEFQGMKKWKLLSRPEIPSRLRWNMSGLPIPNALMEHWNSVSSRSRSNGREIKSEFVRNLGPQSLPPAIWKELSNLPSEEFVPRACLHAFWGKELPRAMVEVYGNASYHDAGQSLANLSVSEICEKDILNDWKRLAWKTLGESLKFAGKFQSVRIFLGRVPSSLAELKEIAKLCTYSRIESDEMEVAIICSKLGLSDSNFRDYCRLIKKEQSEYFSVPYVKVTGEEIGLVGDWYLERLATDDPIGPFLGLYTNCCQHLHGAGSSCAESIWEDSNSAGFIVCYNGSIVAQSFVWRDGNSLVIDSIEALGAAYVEGIAALYGEAVHRITSTRKLGVEEVYLASTSYGITKKVRKLLVPDSEKVKNPFKCPSCYSDANKIVRIA